jgi:hypothetical protein
MLRLILERCEFSINRLLTVRPITGRPIGHEDDQTSVSGRLRQASIQHSQSWPAPSPFCGSSEVIAAKPTGVSIIVCAECHATGRNRRPRAKATRRSKPTRLKSIAALLPAFETRRWSKPDSNLYGAFRVKWLFLVCCSSLFGAGKAVLRPVACDRVRGARGRGQGTETLA